MSTVQPLERTTKKILVTVRDFRTGRITWTLATGTKVGQHYHVRESTLMMLAKDVPIGCTFTSG